MLPCVVCCVNCARWCQLNANTVDREMEEAGSAGPHSSFISPVLCRLIRPWTCSQPCRRAWDSDIADTSLKWASFAGWGGSLCREELWSLASFLLEIFYSGPTGRSRRDDPEHTGGTPYPIWPETASGPEGHGSREGSLLAASTSLTQIGKVAENKNDVSVLQILWSSSAKPMWPSLIIGDAEIPTSEESHTSDITSITSSYASAACEGVKGAQTAPDGLWWRHQTAVKAETWQKSMELIQLSAPALERLTDFSQEFVSEKVLLTHHQVSAPHSVPVKGWISLQVLKQGRGDVEVYVKGRMHAWIYSHEKSSKIRSQNHEIDIDSLCHTYDYLSCDFDFVCHNHIFFFQRAQFSSFSFVVVVFSMDAHFCQSNKKNRWQVGLYEPKWILFLCFSIIMR